MVWLMAPRTLCRAPGDPLLVGAAAPAVPRPPVQARATENEGDSLSPVQPREVGPAATSPGGEGVLGELRLGGSPVLPVARRNPAQTRAKWGRPSLGVGSGHDFGVVRRRPGSG